MEKIIMSISSGYILIIIVNICENLRFDQLVKKYVL